MAPDIRNRGDLDLPEDVDDDGEFFYVDDPVGEEADQYHRPRVRGLLVKAVAVTVIIALLLAFPLGYLLDTELRDGRVTAAIAVTEVTVVVALILVVRSTRRPL